MFPKDSVSQLALAVSLNLSNYTNSATFWHDCLDETHCQAACPNVSVGEDENSLCAIINNASKKLHNHSSTALTHQNIFYFHSRLVWHPDPASMMLTLMPTNKRLFALCLRNIIYQTESLLFLPLESFCALKVKLYVLAELIWLIFFTLFHSYLKFYLKDVRSIWSYSWYTEMSP